MSTKIAFTVAAIQSILAVVVLLGWWDISAEAMSAITLAAGAILTAVAAWLDPNVPFGDTGKSSPPASPSS